MLGLELMCLDSKKKALDSPRDQAVKDRYAEFKGGEAGVGVGGDILSP